MSSQLKTQHVEAAVFTPRSFPQHTFSQTSLVFLRPQRKKKHKNLSSKSICKDRIFKLSAVHCLQRETVLTWSLILTVSFTRKMGGYNSKSVVVTASCLLLVAAFSLSASASSSSSSRAGPVGFAPRSQKKVAFVDPSAAVTSIRKIRGGESTTAEETKEGELSLDDKVQAAMKKLGIAPPDDNDRAAAPDGANCKDGVCDLPTQTTDDENISTATTNPHDMADAISKDMNVGRDLAMAAIGATAKMDDNNNQVYNEQAARDMIQVELDLIANVPEDSDYVKQLVEEGYDSFLCRRALAFADGNMDDARAILLADKMDAEEEERLAREEAEQEEEDTMMAELRKEHEASQAAKPGIVEVKADFDPTTLPTTTSTAAAAAPQPQSLPTGGGPPAGMPGPAKKEDVIFEATTAQIQELVLESPVPVLLDVYAGKYIG